MLVAAVKAQRPAEMAQDRSWLESRTCWRRSRLAPRFRGAASDGAAPSRRGGSHTTTSVRDASVRFVPRRTGAVDGGCPVIFCGGGQCFKSLSTAVCA